MSGECCFCALCGATFADALAWAAHRQWKSRWQRGPCKFPRTMLYESAEVWTLRPSARDAVERAEYGPADEFRIKLGQPSTSPLPKERKRLRRESGKLTPSVSAASRGSSYLCSPTEGP